jgi:hypothetical protein
MEKDSQMDRKLNRSGKQMDG